MKHFLIAITCFICMGAIAQNVGIGTSAPDANAKLDITATDKGILIPRMDSFHRKAIPNTVGLLVYDITTNSFWYNTGTAWQNMAAAASAWSLTGNAGLSATNNFLGTTDDIPLIFRVNNTNAFRLEKDPGNISIGQYNLPNNTTGFYNVALGHFALFQNRTGARNIALGHSALQNLGGGTNNIALGDNSLQKMAGGDANIAIGNGALGQAIAAGPNIGIGSGTLSVSSGSNNVALGIGALAENGGGNFNTATGLYALTKNLDANANTGMGAYALNFNQADSNAAFGYNALGANQAGKNNTAVGVQSVSTNHFGKNITGLGYQADVAADNLTNATAIGANAKVDASNKIRLGDANVTIVESNGVFNTVSDGRFKYNVQENVKGLDFIMKLRPVTYQFDTKKQEQFTKGSLSTEELNSQAIPVAFNETNSIKRTGFIAQEVAAAAEKTGYDFDGVKIPASDKQYYSLSYASFVVPLVKAMQEQQQAIETLKKQNEILLKRLETLEKK